MNKTTFLLAIFIAFQTLTFAQYTAIPDVNFETELVSLGIDSEGTVDGQILTADAEARTSFVDLSNLGISNMAGIEAFINLTSLKASGNPFTTINLSSNVALIDLNLSASALTGLNVDNNTNLEGINVSYSSGITSLNLSNNVLLEIINTEECNNLSSIDLTGLTTLLDVNLYDNDLSSLDIALNTGLQRLVVRQNQLTTLDLSPFSSLTEVNVRDNGMTSLDMRNGNNANVTSFIANFNSDLICIFVDDTAEPNLAIWTIDGNSNFVETEGDCATLSREAAQTFAFDLYPNPASSIINVTSKSEVATLEVYNITGKRVLVKNLSFGNNTVDVTSLKSGVYLARLASQSHLETKKLIIN